MSRPARTDAIILVASDSTSDAELVKKLLKKEFVGADAKLTKFYAAPPLDQKLIGANTITSIRVRTQCGEHIS